MKIQGKSWNLATLLSEYAPGITTEQAELLEVNRKNPKQ